jgi:hypothetical protein
VIHGDKCIAATQAGTASLAKLRRATRMPERELLHKLFRGDFGVG